MTANTCPLHKCEAQSLQRESAPQRSDNSFSQRLKNAQEELEKKAPPLFDPISQLSALFNHDVLPLKFDFEFSANKAQSDPEGQRQENELRAAPLKEEPQQANQIAPENEKDLVINDLEVIKEALIQNLPYPVFAAALPMPALQSTHPTLSKSSLQFLIDQISEKAELLKNSSSTKLTLSISQEELGDLLVELTSRSGQVLIHISAPQQIKKELEDSLEELKRALKESKIDLAQIEIKEIKEEEPHAGYNFPG